MISDKNIRIKITVPKSLDNLTNQILQQIPNTTKSRLYICAMTLLLSQSNHGADCLKAGEKEKNQ